MPVSLDPLSHAWHIHIYIFIVLSFLPDDVQEVKGGFFFSFPPFLSSLFLPVKNIKYQDNKIDFYTVRSELVQEEGGVTWGGL